MIKTLLFLALSASCALAETVIDRKEAVLISGDGLTTIPANSIGTPAQISVLGTQACSAKALATNNAAVAALALNRVQLFSTNYVVTSTVYVQSVGGVPYDPSNQTIRVCSVSQIASNVVIVGTVRQLPLVPPVLDWRQRLNSGAWSNVHATVAQVSIPFGVTNAAAAYSFTVPRPSSGSAFFRVVDNSSGASGSGMYWVVFGAIFIDGHKGWSGSISNVVGGVTNIYMSKGGLLVEPQPLGGF